MSGPSPDHARPASSSSFWQCGRFRVALDRPRIMGILNLTPDSFSDGGAFLSPEAALRQAQALIEQGADLLDLGAESTRPGAATVPASEEIARLLPVLRSLRDCGLPLSVDTRKPEVMRAVLAEGADIINDVAGFRSPEAVEAVAQGETGLCLMHMQGEPATMQSDTHYPLGVFEGVRLWLAERVAALRARGVEARRMCLDPGIGFGKTHEQGLTLLRDLRALSTGVEGLPLLIGVSRKSLVGALTGQPVDQRLAGSLAAALHAAHSGAAVLRVHDVGATRDALRVWQALQG